MELMWSYACDNRHYFIVDMQLAHVIGVQCTNEANHYCCFNAKRWEHFEDQQPLDQTDHLFKPSKAYIQQGNVKSNQWMVSILMIVFICLEHLELRIVVFEECGGNNMNRCTWKCKYK